MPKSRRKEPPLGNDIATAHAKQIAHRLKFLRAQVGLTQQQLAQRAHVGRSFLSALENARAALPRYMTLVRLATGLEVEVADLVRRPPRREDASNVKEPGQS